MGARKKQQTTKGQAVIMGVFALLLLASNAAAVLWEGRPATAVYWGGQALYLAFVALSLWLYRRASKRSPKVD
ncbi:MAG: hypothetical protein JWQ75_807 [Pseudarthrobacter sp.]|jgi:hypothetical protein|nr:hypothetical protein [Pseudarthrobacter sp.]